MKRFDVGYSKGIENPEGDWVDAGIAQELYDALKESCEWVEEYVSQMSAYVISDDAAECLVRIQKVIEKADKDQTMEHKSLKTYCYSARGYVKFTHEQILLYGQCKDYRGYIYKDFEVYQDDVIKQIVFEVEVNKSLVKDITYIEAFKILLG